MMRVDSIIPPMNYYPQMERPQVSIPENTALPGNSPIVSISAEAKAAYERDMALEKGGIGKVDPAKELTGCQTCRNRKYVDRSSDPSVSFQSPAHISPGQAAAVVMSHEREHISNDQAKAAQNDRRVISQTVSLTMSTCPECGKMYVSGGVARTVTASKNSAENPEES